MNMIKVLAYGTFALGILPGCGPAKPELHIYTWSDYIAKGVIAKFEKENGCVVKVDTFDSNEAMFARLKAGASGYDIIMPSSYQIPAMIKCGMVLELDHSKLPNVRRNFDKDYAACILDPTFDYSVPYSVTYTGFAYRKDKAGDAPIDSWKVFETDAFKGRMSLLSDMRETIGGALKALGHSLNSTRKDEIDAAANMVIGWKRNVAKFDNEQYKKAVASSEWFVGLGYSSDVIQLMMEDGNIGFSLPKEGFTIAFDEMVVFSGSKQVDLAHRFINFCYDPDVAAANMSEVCSPMPVTGATAKLDGKLQKLMLLDAQTLSRGEVMRDFDDDRQDVRKMYMDAWDRVMAGE